jgi:site-specific DNA recombinase
MRVATYTRISTDEENQPYSLCAQDDRLAAYIRSQDGWESARRYSDQMTGSTLERPDLQRALSDARAGRFDLLLVYRVDRLARSVRGLAQILDELDQSRVLFRSATEPFDTGSAAGRMMVQMLGVFAEFERATLIDRVVAGMERKAARGEWHGGKSPYGYAIEAGTLVPVESEAAVVNLIFDLCKTERLGARSIAMSLNDRGYRTRAGRPWGHKTVLDMLRNPIYVGDVAFRGAVHPGGHSGILPRETFEACTALLTERGEDHSLRASNSSEYLLAGLMRCKSCRRRMVGTAAHGRLYRYRYYICHDRQSYGRHGCAAGRLGADRTEDAILNALLKTYEKPGLVRAALTRAAEKRAAGQPKVAQELAVVAADITRAEDAIKRYQVAFEAGSMQPEVCGTRLQELGIQLRDLRSREAELELATNDQAVPDITDEWIAEIHDEIVATLNEGSPAQKKALLKRLIVDVEIDGKLAYPKYRVPTAGVRIVGTLVDPRGFEPLTF